MFLVESTELDIDVRFYYYHWVDTSVGGIWFSSSRRPLNYFAFQPFDFERTWWRLFQKRVVCTKLDIYVFITISLLLH